MKLAIFASSALVATASFAQAQSAVGIYGVIDVGVAYANSGKGAGHQVALRHNNLYGSRLGFRGREDLGGGLAAIFNLEMGLKPDDGQFTFAGRPFGREASVGLENANNRLQLGRLVSPLLEGVNRYAATHAGPHLPNQDPAFSAARLDDSIRYTRTDGFFEANAFYSLGYDAVATPIGGAPGGMNRARNRAFSIGYNDPKTFGVNFVYDKLKGPLNPVASGVGYMAPSLRPATSTGADSATRYLLAGKWKLSGETTLFSGVRHLNTTFGARKLTSDLVWLQARQSITPRILVDFGVSHQRIKGVDAKATSYVIQSQYLFSKRTSAYLNFLHVSNGRLSVIGVNSNDPVRPGASQSGIQTGIAHWF